MRVGICDDDEKWCRKAKEIIERYMENIGEKTEIQYFLSSSQMKLYKESPFEVVFMDIELEDDNGIETSAYINQKWKNCQIVYLTNYIFYATEIYHTSHVFYALKEQFEERIGEIMGNVFHALAQTREKLIFSVIGGKELALVPEDIFYFERHGRATTIVTKWDSYEIRDKLTELAKYLPSLDFVRCHNSYIVYLPAVREMEKGNFLLKDGTRIMISRSYMKPVKNAFMKWAQTQIS